MSARQEWVWTEKGKKRDEATFGFSTPTKLSNVAIRIRLSFGHAVYYLNDPSKGSVGGGRATGICYRGSANHRPISDHDGPRSQAVGPRSAGKRRSPPSTFSLQQLLAVYWVRTRRGVFGGQLSDERTSLPLQLQRLLPPRWVMSVLEPRPTLAGRRSQQRCSGYRRLIEEVAEFSFLPPKTDVLAFSLTSHSLLRGLLCVRAPENFGPKSHEIRFKAMTVTRRNQGPWQEGFP